ncbi:MAG: RNA 3'-terminal phosphate cyclase [Candidatus Pacebacteria bacterium]|nr:RNA 3'-terminal phosphate cyclase [Candidatus Paceibacterota bacterium]
MGNINDQKLIKIDGSKYEGGGQILRTTIALSAATKKPCHVFNIRKNRPKPGLSNQHVLGLKTMANLYNADLKTNFLGSQEIWFHPKEIVSKNISINIPTAASITLILQGLILTGLRAQFPIEISFNGGATDTFFSPTIDHFEFVFLEILKKMGVKIDVDIHKRGFYPEGAAKVQVKIYPYSLKKLFLTKREKLKKITIISGASESLKKQKTAERQISGAKQVLGKLNFSLEEKFEYYSSQSAGSQINIIAELENTVFGTDNLGKLGKSSEQVGIEVAKKFLQEIRSNACLDKYTADQILPFMALANKKSQITTSEITSHCQTNIWVIEQFLNNGKPSTRAKLGAGLVPHRNKVSGAGFEIIGNKISWNPK